MKALTKRTFQSTIDDTPLAVVVFHEHGCRACRQFDGVIRRIEAERRKRKAAPTVTFFRVRVRGNEAIAEAQRIMEWPSMVFFKWGRKVGKVGGNFDIDDTRTIIANFLRLAH
jgi:thioredoxin-like negative regulator of GroEL